MYSYLEKLNLFKILQISANSQLEKISISYELPVFDPIFLKTINGALKTKTSSHPNNLIY